MHWRRIKPERVARAEHLSRVLENLRRLSHVDSSNALLGSVSADTVTFAVGSPGGGIEVGSKRSFTTQSAPTFTDAIHLFARERGIDLDGRLLVLSVAGAVRGDSVKITNGKWFISISGLRSILRRSPIVLNDVSAVAWASLMLDPRDVQLVDAVQTGKVENGRYALIWVGDGLGAAALSQDALGTPHVLDGEMGHMTAAIEASDHPQLLDAVRLRHGHLSYERAITHLAEQASDRSLEPGRRSSLQLGAATLLAAFAGNVALAYGAWNGVFLAGPGVSAIVHAGTAIKFRERFVAKGRFRTTLSSVPLWTLNRPELPLLGCLARASVAESRKEEQRSPLQ